MNAVNEAAPRRPVWLTVLALVLAVAVALGSMFPLKKYVTKEETFTRSIASIDERKAAVTALSAAAAAAATAVAAIPGDATTPIAEQIMEVSSYLLIVVCVLVLEKSAERSVLQIVIEEGRNRQVRRMCEAVGLQVKRLRRTAIGPVKLGMLQPGKWRELTAAEVGALRNAAGGTAAAEPAKPAKTRRR